MAREFWIKNMGEEPMQCYSCKEYLEEWHTHEDYHVIEYSAYEALAEKLEIALVALADIQSINPTGTYGRIPTEQVTAAALMLEIANDAIEDIKEVN